MPDLVRRLWAVLGWNTLLALVVAVGAMALSVEFGWRLDFPLTIVGIAVVFPIVFSISGAYKRREAALVQYGIMKSSARSIVLATRDWHQPTAGELGEDAKAMKGRMSNIFSLCVSLFQTTTDTQFAKIEQTIYQEFSNLSVAIEALRERGISPGEMGRIHGYQHGFVTAFETLKHIYQYRTPRTLRLYSKLFIYVTLIAMGPHFATIADEQTVWLGYSLPILFAMIFTGLDNIQEHLENPFDQIGEDDIQIKPEKFLQTIT